MEVKRARTSTSPPGAQKKKRVESQGILEANDLVVTECTAAEGSEEQSTSALAQPSLNDSRISKNIASKFSKPEDSSDSIESFCAPITLNGIGIGKLTAKKIELDAKLVTEKDGTTISISKPGKRLLSIAGHDVHHQLHHENFHLKLPRTACSIVEISLTSQGCRASADDEVFFQQEYNPEREGLALAAKIYEIDKKHKVKPPADDNEWSAMYKEWRTWTTAKLEDIRNMKSFPRMPEKVRRCHNADCSRKLPDGAPRPFRNLDHCRHDIQMWFRDVAGGYNQTYYEIVKYEEQKWDPAMFNVLGQDVTELQMKFRKMAGEVWRYARDMVDEYKEGMTGTVLENGIILD